jgi:hypothetical protein
MAERGADMPGGRGCTCLCTAWDHVGVCTGTADTTVPLSCPVRGPAETPGPAIVRIDAPMCSACAAAVLAADTNARDGVQ